MPTNISTVMVVV